MRHLAVLCLFLGATAFLPASPPPALNPAPSLVPSVASAVASDSATPTPSTWRSLLLTRTELPDARNALVRWRPDFPSFFPADPEINHALLLFSSPLANTPANVPALRSWLAPLSARLSGWTLHAGESLQMPPLFGPETPFPDHQPLRQLAILRIAASKLAWLDGHPNDALDLTLDNLALARILLTSQEEIIPLLNASGIWQLALDQVYWFARQPTLTPAQATRLQAVLLADAPLASDALARSFRGEFTFFTRIVLERLPRTRDVDLLLSSIGSLGLAPPQPTTEGEPRLAPAEHDPVDLEATLQASADDVRGWLNAFSSDPRHPRGLTATHTGLLIQGYSREIPLLTRYAISEGIPTPAQFTAINAEIAGVTNPVGKLFLMITTTNWEPVSESIFRREAQRSALTGLLAWRRLGKPAPWSALVSANLLPAAPLDPFAPVVGEPLRFDLKTPRVWSVGINGTDEGGTGDGENTGRPEDLTWPLAGPAPLHVFARRHQSRFSPAPTH